MDFKTAITVNGTQLTDGQGSVPFGRLPVAASGESSAVKLVRADDSRLAAGTPAWSAITGKPTTIAGFGITDPLAYKNADNQFTVAQGMRAAASGQAAGLYVPWVSGDASPTLLVGSTTSGMNQIAIYGKSVSSVGVQGESYGGTGVLGRATGASAIPLVGMMDTTYVAVAATALVLRHRTSGTPAAGFGSSLLYQANHTSGADVMVGAVTALWTDIAAGKSALTFSTTAGLSLSERMRLTGAGYLGIGTTDPQAPLHVLAGTKEALRISSAAGKGSAIMSWASGSNGDSIFLSSNAAWDGANWQRIETAYSAWKLYLGHSAGDILAVERGAAGANPATFTELLRITATGKIGVGTTDPRAALDVKDGYMRARDGANNAPNAGKGLELVSTGGVGYIQSVDRDNANATLPIYFAASKVTLPGQVYTGSAATYLGSDDGQRISVHGGNLVAWGGVYVASVGWMTDVLNQSVKTDASPTFKTARIGEHANYLNNASFWKNGDANYTLHADGFHAYLNANQPSGLIYFRTGNATRATLDNTGTFSCNGTVYAGSSVSANGGIGTNHFYANASGGLPFSMFTAEPGISYTNAVLGYNYAALNGSASGRVNGGYGGGYIRFKSDSSMEAHTLLSNGTDRAVWQIFDGMMGIGCNSTSTHRLDVQGIDFTSTNYILRCMNGGAGDVLRVRNDADVWANNVWRSGSDARMKQDIVAAPYGLAEVLRLTPVRYARRMNGRVELGFIAQQVQPILPELVGVEDDGMLSLCYDGIIPVLTRAIQELHAEIEQLRGRSMLGRLRRWITKLRLS